MAEHGEVEEAIAALARGEMVVVVEEDDGGEGAVVLGAVDITPIAINFMTRQAGGPICLVLPPERCDELGLHTLGSDDDGREHRTAFTVTIEAAHGVTTGISAEDQARTMLVAVDPSSSADALVTPGHVRPVRARPDGVLERPHIAEATVDLVRLAGLTPAGVACPIQRDDGEMARDDDLVRYCERHGLVRVSIPKLAEYRRARAPVVDRYSVAPLTTAYGEFEHIGLRSVDDGAHHLALVAGEVDGADGVVVSVHGACLIDELFGAAGCHCGERLRDGLRTAGESGAGVVVRLDGLGPAAAGGPCQALGQREGRIAAHILKDLGVRSVDLRGDATWAATFAAFGLRVT